MYKIIVNGIELDLPSNANIVINRLLYDYSNPANIHGEFTNNLILRHTANNVKALNLLKDGALSQSFTANVILNEVLLFKATGTLKDFIPNISVKAQFVSELQALFTRFQKPLYDFPSINGGFDFKYNLTDYNAVKTNTNYIYSWPLIDDRYVVGAQTQIYQDAQGTRPNLTYIRPHYRVRRLLEQVFLSENYTLDSSLLSSSSFDNLMLSSNADDFYFTDDEILLENEAITKGDKVEWTNISHTIASINFDLDTTTNPDYLILNGFNDSSNRLAIDITFAETNVQMFVKSIALLSTGQPEALNTFQTEENGNRIHIAYTSPFEFLQFRFDKNVTIQSMRITNLFSEREFYSSGQNPFFGSDVLDEWEKELFDISANPLGKFPMLWGYSVKEQYNVPNWTKAELVRLVCNVYNCEIKLIGGVTAQLVPRNVFNALNPIDLTDKITMRSARNVFAEFPNQTTFSYDNNEYVEVRNEAQPFEFNVFNSTFRNGSAAVDFGISGNIQRPVALLSTNEPLVRNLIYQIDGSADKNTDPDFRKEIKPHFFMYSEDVPTQYVNDFNINSIGTWSQGTPNLTTEYIFDEHYSSLYQNTENSKVYNIEARLTYIDYLQLMSDRMFYDADLGRRLRVLSIMKFNEEGTTQIKAITEEF